MRKWISVFLLVLVAVSAASELSLVDRIAPTKPGVIQPLSHGEGG